MNGNKVEFKDEAALDAVLLATKEREYDNNEIPIVVGHPKTDSPAFGWVKKDSLFREGDTLYALAEDDQVTDELKTLLKKKMFKKISPKIYKDGSVAHFGFLGAVAPAIKGLPSYSFSSEEDGNEITFELSEYVVDEWSNRSIGRILRKIKLYFAEKEGAQKAEELINEYDLEEAAKPPRVYEKKNPLNYSFSQSEEEIEQQKIEEEEMKELDDAKAALTAKETELAEANAKLKEFTDKQAADALTARTAEFVAFCESDEVKLKIKDGEKDEIVSTLLALDSIEAFEFGEGDAKKTVSAVDVVKGFITRLPNLVEPGEKFNNKNSADNKPVKDEAVELAEEIEKLVDEEKTAGRTISYAEASQKVKAKK